MTRVSSCMDSRGIRAVIGRQCKLRKTTTQICSDVERTAPTAPPARPPRLNQGGKSPHAMLQNCDLETDQNAYNIPTMSELLSQRLTRRQMFHVLGMSAAAAAL